MISSATAQSHPERFDRLRRASASLILLAFLALVSCGRETVQKRIDLETRTTASRQEPNPAAPPEPTETGSVPEPSTNEPARAEEPIPEDPVEAR